jgi:RNA polymerase subunit RPABC4/transcription elongation factor Spt4
VQKVKKKVKVMEMPDRCVCCGEIIPEGRQACPNCVKKGKAKK